MHLGERECSLQRRHQKVIEEAPSPVLDAATRAAMGRAAVEAARACGYEGAGTVELIAAGDPRPDEGWFFLEMNTRLQVEHPVTELVWGLDLVEQQLRVAAGQPLAFTQDDLAPSGHAVEARVYAEDPARGFLPTGGRLVVWDEPRGVRVDSGVATGSVVTSHYDPMLAKVIAHGATRDEALARLHAGLGELVALGVTTNVAFLRALLEHPDVRAGRLDTGLIERDLDELLPPTTTPEDVLRAVGLASVARRRPKPGRPADPFARSDRLAPGRGRLDDVAAVGRRPRGRRARARHRRLRGGRGGPRRRRGAGRARRGVRRRAARRAGRGRTHLPPWCCDPTTPGSVATGPRGWSANATAWRPSGTARRSAPAAA